MPWIAIDRDTDQAGIFCKYGELIEFLSDCAKVPRVYLAEECQIIQQSGEVIAVQVTAYKYPKGLGR